MKIWRSQNSLQLTFPAMDCLHRAHTKQSLCQWRPSNDMNLVPPWPVMGLEQAAHLLANTLSSSLSSSSSLAMSSSPPRSSQRSKACPLGWRTSDPQAAPRTEHTRNTPALSLSLWLSLLVFPPCARAPPWRWRRQNWGPFCILCTWLLFCPQSRPCRIYPYHSEWWMIYHFPRPI